MKSPAATTGSDPDAGKTRLRCALCGYRFTRDEAREPCGACVLHPSGCGAICCPRCGYSFVSESKLVTWVRRLFGR